MLLTCSWRHMCISGVSQRRHRDSSLPSLLSPPLFSFFCLFLSFPSFFLSLVQRLWGQLKSLPACVHLYLWEVTSSLCRWPIWLQYLNVLLSFVCKCSQEHFCICAHQEHWSVALLVVLYVYPVLVSGLHWPHRMTMSLSLPILLPWDSLRNISFSFLKSLAELSCKSVSLSFSFYLLKIFKKLHLLLYY